MFCLNVSKCFQMFPSLALMQQTGEVGPFRSCTDVSVTLYHLWSSVKAFIGSVGVAGWATVHLQIVLNDCPSSRTSLNCEYRWTVAHLNTRLSLKSSSALGAVVKVVHALCSLVVVMCVFFCRAVLILSVLILHSLVKVTPSERVQSAFLLSHLSPEWPIVKEMPAGWLPK